MSLEDELRGVMREHDREAPRGVRFVAPRSSRTKVWAPLAAAVLVALLALGTTFVLRGDANRQAAGASGCPDRYPKSNRDPVPRDPTARGASNRLVPMTTPSSAFVCSYGPVFAEQRSPGRSRLERSRTIRGDLSLIARFLTDLPEGGQPTFCTADIQAADREDYFIGLRYGAGVVWIAAPGNHCEGSTNGIFESRENLRDYAHDLVETGRAVPSPRQRTCSNESGRLGDDQELVPGTPESADLCMINASTPKKTITGSMLTELASTLNALRTRRGNGCNPTGHVSDYEVTFRYPRGPGVTVLLQPGCQPNVQGAVLQATAPASQLDRFLP